VQITDKATYTYSLHHAGIHLGPSPTNLDLPAGEDSAIQGIPAEATPVSCAGKFIPFPI
jgi:hypothetical protein